MRMSAVKNYTDNPITFDRIETAIDQEVARNIFTLARSCPHIKYSLVTSCSIDDFVQFSILGK